MKILLGSMLALSVVACGQWYQPRGGSSYGSSGGGASAPATGAASPQAPSHGESAPAPMIPTSVSVHSDCGKTIPLFIGERPKWGSGTRTSISSNTTTTFGRNPDGAVTIWIIDEQENGISSAHVTAQTREVTIDASCKSITAR